MHRVFIATFGWGLSYVLNKIQVSSLPPMANAFVRDFFFVVILWILYLFSKSFKDDRRILKKDKNLWGTLILSGILSLGLMHVFIYAGLQYIEASFSVVLAGTFLPSVQIILGVIFLRETITKGQIAAIFTSIIGVSLIGYQALAEVSFNFTTLLGAFYILLAQASYGFYTLISKDGMNKMSTFGFLTVNSTFGTLFLIIPLLLEGSFHTLFQASTRYWVVTAILVIFSSVLALYFWQQAIKIYPMKLLSAFYILVPIIGVVLSIIILGERVNVIKWLGITISLTSALYIIKSSNSNQYKEKTFRLRSNI